MTNEERKKKQQYPKWQPKMEQYQLDLNKAAVDGDMKKVGQYTLIINQLWDKYHQNQK
ncbi:hypothetical protein [Acetilactobacillus jinshanensis]|uniref:hypothetical protein n=1 Tax=Acetilactobacillus jinshanensis TaxID=1720083 RepID=UPI0013A67D90|nr:hypothetical protein [Acetilactobacillus jinshanensis]URL61731.1 hypothetical protein HGK75_07250 [uncultured bacterium]